MTAERREQGRRRQARLFGYDSEQNLCEVSQIAPGMEAALAAAPSSLRYDAAGRVAERGDAQYRYDECGRLQVKRETRPGFRPRETRYQWDTQDRLVRVQLPDGGRWRYRYDAFGRRISKVREGQVESAQAVSRVAYRWDGDQLVGQQQYLADGTAARQVQWVYEPGSFRPLAQLERQDEETRLHYVVTDVAGTARELCSEEGEVHWRGEQGLWDAHREDRRAIRLRRYLGDAANEEVYCELRYQGQIYDAETGLYYNRHRYYDAQSGQYISPDPIGLAGSIRPQGYVFNPLEWVDPLGLEKKGPHSDKVPLSRNSARKLLKSRGLNKQIQHDTVNSFDGQIYASQGKKGDVFTITEDTPGSASQVYVTRGSAGATAAERRANLALPPNNSASYEGKVMLTRDQVLLEGRVAPQPQWGADKVGGGWQVVTGGGKYSGATKLTP